MKALAIDPSVNNVGWCTLDFGASSPSESVSGGTWKPEGDNLEQRITDLRQMIEAEVGEFEFLICEKPAFFNSEKGLIAAHMNYTIDLAAVDYYLAGYFGKTHRNFWCVTPMTWKGSVPKDVTYFKFKRIMHRKYVSMSDISEHQVDATMLMWWWLERIAVGLPKILRGKDPLSPAEIVEFFASREPSRHGSRRISSRRSSKQSR